MDVRNFDLLAGDGQPFALELRHFREVEVSHLHRWDDHVERFFSAGADRFAHLLDIREHVNQALIKAKVSHSANHFAVFNKEGAVAGHAGEDLFVRVNFADVPEASDQNSAL